MVYSIKLEKPFTTRAQNRSGLLRRFHVKHFTRARPFYYQVRPIYRGLKTFLGEVVIIRPYKKK